MHEFSYRILTFDNFGIDLVLINIYLGAARCSLPLPSSAVTGDAFHY